MKPINSIIHLKKNEDHRIRNGHLWIYSNEIDTQKSPLSNFEPGELVKVANASGKFLGIAYINPHCLLCARLLTRNSGQDIDEDWMVEKISTALAFRQQYFTEPYYRLVFGESDNLPGLVIDRFDNTYILQFNTAGMERLQDLVLVALEKICKPARIILRNDSSMRELEKLESYTRIFSGENNPLTLKENGASFELPPLSGQKTGWFYDHRVNRYQLKHYVKGKRVLDVFSYVGGWGIEAASFGAQEVSCIDSSATALDVLKTNAARNQVDHCIKLYCEDAFKALEKMSLSGQKFDVVIVDPPAFIKRKKDIPAGKHAYLRINELALKVLTNNGILISSSCSFFLTRDDLREVLQKAATRLNINLQIVAQGSQGPDHPIHPAIPETEYLKTFFCRSTLQ